MAFQAAVRTFNWLTSHAANATIDVDFGFTPKAVFLLSCTSQTATGVSGTLERGGARIGLAGGTLSANRGCVAYETFDAAAAADVRASSGITSVLRLSGSTGRLDIDAEANWPANSVRFIVDAAMSSGINAHIMVWAIAGTDVVASTMGTITEPGATGNQTTTTTGVNPSFVLLASSETTSEDTVHGEGAFMLGAGDGTRSWVIATGSDDANVTMDTVGYGKSGQIVALLPTATAVTIDAEATLGSLGTGQFVLNWSTRTAAARKIRYIAIQLATSVAHVDSFLTRTDTNNFALTGFGMQPACALFASTGRAESTATTPTAHGMISLGLAESATVREAAAFRDEDAVPNAKVTVALNTAAVYIHLSDGAVDGGMDVKSFDPDGMTMGMTDADPAQSFVGVLAIGAAGAAFMAAPQKPILQAVNRSNTY